MSRTKRKPSADESMIPMINVVFLLLIFFMAAGQISSLRDHGVAVPQTDMGEMAQQTPLSLHYRSDASLLVNGVEVAMALLPEHLAEAKNATVNLYVDSQLSAVDLEKVLAILREEQVADVTLMVRTQAEVRP